MDHTERWEREMKEVFGRMFPLVPVRDLPYVPSHITGFLEKRIAQEVEWQTQHFTTQVVKVLCEVTHPKTHLVDMVRMVVNRIKKLEQLRLSLLADYEVNIQKHKEGKQQLDPNVLRFIENHRDQIREAGEG